MSRVIDHTSPLDMNPIKRMPASVVAYWQEILSIVDKINGSADWWEWLRSGPFRYLDLDAGGLDWYEVKKRKTGHIQGRPRRAQSFSQRGAVLKVGINPDERSLMTISEEEASGQAAADIEAVLISCATKFGLVAPPFRAATATEAEGLLPR